MLKKKEKSKLFQWGKAFLFAFLFLSMISIITLMFMVHLSYDLPTLDELKNFNPEQISKVISADGQVLHKLQAVKKREVIKIGEVPQELIDALLVMEDKEFYNHSGFSIKSTMRAVIVNLLTLRYKQGASTLTQQLARSMYEKITWKDRSIIRKVKELITAFNIEQTYTKSEILELYLNSVFLGHGRYGVQSASQLYFKKDVSKLNLDECAMLVGMLPAPNLYSPFRNFDLANERKSLVLDIMKENHLIDLYDYTFYYDKKLDIADRTSENFSGIAPYFNEHIRKELEKIDKELGVNIYRDGLKIHTTIDPKIQKIIEESFQGNMSNNQKVLNKEFINNPWRLKKVLKGTDFEVDEIIEILKNNDIIPIELRDKLLVQGAMVAIDPTNGNILGMIGGRQENEYRDHFNRATQAKRQPGSVFKPMIYMTALEQGYKPTAQLLNQPLIVFIDDTTQWNPQNHDGSTGLLTTLREGLRRSLNLISVRIVQELIQPRDVVMNARAFGLTTPIRGVDAIALGVSEVYPLEITAAYSAIANNGIYTEPLAITRIEDRHGQMIKEFIPVSREIKDEAVIYLLRDMMKSVVDAGTGGSIRWKYKFYSPAAGKTGTTNSKADAWFVGFTPQLAIGVWVGMDDPAVSLGEKQFGSSAALPIFAQAVRDIYTTGEIAYNNETIILDKLADWKRPDGIVEVEICKETYDKATHMCPLSREIFLKDYRPRQSCQKHANPFSRFRDK